MQNIVMSMRGKFHDDWGETTEPYGIKNLITTTTMFVALGDPFSGLITKSGMCDVFTVACY